MQSCLFALVGIGLAVSADPSKEDQIKDQLKKLEGTWVVRSAMYDGKPVEEDKGMEYRFSGDKVTIRKFGTGESFTCKLDPTQKPMTMDLIHDQPKPFDLSEVAVYELDGSTLRICVAPRSADKRPKDFDESKQDVWVLRRKKEIDKLGGTTLVYETAQDKLTDEIQRRLRESLLDRLDGDRRLDIDIAFPNRAQVEIRIPRGDDHAKIVERVKWLMSQKGNMEFLIAANTEHDGDALKEIEKWFAPDKDKQADRARELEQRTTKHLPSPAPGKNWKWSNKALGDAQYRWCWLSQAFHESYKLAEPHDAKGKPLALSQKDPEQRAKLETILKNGKLDDGTELDAWWISLAQARLAGVPILVNKIGDRAVDLFMFSREATPVKDEGGVSYEYFALLRETEPKHKVSGIDIESADWFAGEINFRLSKAAGERNLAFTEANRRQQLAIALDDSLLMSATIQSVIGKKGCVSFGIGSSAEEGLKIAGLMNSGPLPVDLKPEPVSEKEVPAEK
jgi:uncharacterized protein (TIGR03067 family)